MSDQLGDTLKMVQIGFYVIAGVVAVLTYRAAKRGLLNTVNTEYQKRVLDRLAKLSEDLYSEFNPNSDSYLTSHKGVEQALGLIHNDFEGAKGEILSAGEWHGWVLLPRDTLNLEKVLEPVRSDPFIPENIREAVIVLLEHRLEAFGEVSNEALQEYRNALAAGKITPRDDNWVAVINRINAGMAKAGCGPGQVERAVHDIRGMIQDYFDQFNVHGVGKGWRKKHEKQPDESA
jgi:hypothetical protein